MAAAAWEANYPRRGRAGIPSSAISAVGVRNRANTARRFSLGAGLCGCNPWVYPFRTGTLPGCIGCLLRAFACSAGLPATSFLEATSLYADRDRWIKEEVNEALSPAPIRVLSVTSGHWPGYRQAQLHCRKGGGHQGGRASEDIATDRLAAEEQQESKFEPTLTDAEYQELVGLDRSPPGKLYRWVGEHAT